MGFLRLRTAAVAIGLLGAASATAIGAPGPASTPGKAVYKSKCLICHPNSPADTNAPHYKARPDAVPLWTLYSEDDGWQRSQVGLGQWNDRKMERWLRYPKRMKPDTRMVEVPMSADKREAVIKYLKDLGRRFGQ